MSILPLDPFTVPLAGTTLIEASAGTGKTHTISTLYLRLLLEKELPVERILVVTFTRAATAELGERIRSRIGELLGVLSGKPSKDRELMELAARRPAQQHERDRIRLLTALYSFDLAAIFTIHSFCLQTLQQYAFEGGVAFDTELSDNVQRLAEQFLDAFWIRFVHESGDPLVADLFRLERRTKKLTAAGARQRLGELVRAKLRHPDLEFVWPDLDAPEEEQWWAHLCQRCLDFVLPELERHKQRQRKLGFDDILQRLRAALRGPAGPRLAEAIRQQYAAALIDEFQDTDPVQYEIFRRLYVGQPDCALFLIGDPKQSIYAFRGADVFAYLQGKRDAQHQFTLRKNWRSGPRLVHAVNHLFSRDPTGKPFVIEGIDFIPAEPALEFADPDCCLEFLYVAQDSGRPSAPKKEATDLLCQVTARDIRAFVARQPVLAGEPISYGSVAVLCNTNEQALRVQRALRACRIPSALESEASVFDSDEARELEWVLQAIVDPAHPATVCTAQATALLGSGMEELLAFQRDENSPQWEACVDRLYQWREEWHRHGVMAVVQRVFEECDVARRLLEWVDGERRLTNFLHLAEVLHRASVEQRLDPPAVVHWLALMRRSEEARASDVGFGEETQLRLESDERAVKLVTVHKSKGLQYGVVYCPFLWEQSVRRRSGVALFHRPSDLRLLLDARLQPGEESGRLAQREAEAEARRRLYVALTRARLRCTVLWGNFNQAAQSALAGLLHPHAREIGKKEGQAKWHKQWIQEGDAAFLRDLEQLAASSGDTIRVRQWKEGEASEREATRVPEEQVPRLVARVAERKFSAAWRVASFTTLTEGHDPTRPVLAEGEDYDSLARRSADDAPVVESSLSFRSLPAGAHTGELLHRMLERLDFSRPVAEQHETLEAELSDSPLGDLADLETSLQLVLDTPLPAGFRLADVGKTRLNELDFLLPVGQGATGSDGPRRQVSPRDIQQVFASTCTLPNAREYAQSIAKLPFSAWLGYLKGYIDLAFEHGGRWYLVDYKSNDLGCRIDDYTPARLLPVMAQHHYLLQYHLYAVALHRFLRERLRDYDYEREFGGVMYLFVRGMSPHHPPSTGVFFDRPALALVQALDDLFAGVVAR